MPNAIKFTPRGGNVRLKIEYALARGVVFHVEDTGIGMSPAEISIALEPFGQVDSGLARKYNGVGLGLPLIKRLIELHGGSTGTVCGSSDPPDRLGRVDRRPFRAR